MFTISILMPETFQVRVPVSVPRKWKKGLQAQNNPPSLPQKNVVLFPLQRPHSPKKVTCELSLLLLSPPSLWASSPGVPRGTGVGEGKGKGEFALASHKIEYLRPRMGCEMLIGWFLIRQWCYVPVGELAYRLRAKTPLLAWNLSNLSPFCPTARSPQENFPAGYSPPCFERFFSEWVFLKNHHIYFAMLAVNQNGRQRNTL